MNKLRIQLTTLYGSDEILLARQWRRYQQLIKLFQARFGGQDIQVLSVPGRTELGGNHTDHNRGKVLAATINLDSIAVAAANNTNTITVLSAGYAEAFEIDLNELEPKREERGSTTALIRGIAACLKDSGYSVGGFNAQIFSDVLPGSGLSSSASFEVLVGALFNKLFNNGNIPPEVLAKAGRFAENMYFGKPCGLMDQLTCAVGGIVAIDFKSEEHPVIKRINFDFSSQDVALAIVHTGGNHTDLTGAYAAIPAEMKAVASILGKRSLREISEKKFRRKIPEIRRQAGDRAVLRALHFFQENERVEAMADALEKGKIADFLDLVNASGNSSFKWLQNIYVTNNSRKQDIALALGLSERFISRAGFGACRVHGGGFAGTIQVFLPKKDLAEYKQLLEPVFGEKSVRELFIRPMGIFNYA